MNKEASPLHPPCVPILLRNAKRKGRQKRFNSWLMVNLGLVYSMAGPNCPFSLGWREGRDYLQAHLFKIGLADSPLYTLCNSVSMSGEYGVNVDQPPRNSSRRSSPVVKERLYRVLPNSTDKYRGVIVGSMGTTNYRRTWGRKPDFVKILSQSELFDEFSKLSIRCPELSVLHRLQ
ncbi:hypothetical protein TNCV_956191 [Trichonephila clavipes]|nr:hypothetical protein TNCV_956191 [Trichonephila clavipes]